MNPYQALDDRAFWKTAVGNRSHFALEQLYIKKYDISPEDRIATAGSCFAQHIARHLVKSGFNYVDYEPPPKMLPPAMHPDFNYGVYSARYGNIYTTRQLLQLMERAYGDRSPIDGVWRGKDGKGFVDPFRPALEPTPFASEAEVQAARRGHFLAVRELFETTDIFIFTLGLTEAWTDVRDGSVYPLCPGTAAGDFDAERYAFVNFTHAEVLADLRDAIEWMRELNPGLRIILTVSPVPLVATASGNHVLAATTYSKAVLRAVAGQLAAEDPDIDYFPSYEVIASPTARGAFFGPNLRDVEPAGVELVMSHFFAQHDPGAGAVRGRVRTENTDDEDDEEPDEGDLVCEEMLLEQARR